MFVDILQNMSSGYKVLLEKPPLTISTTGLRILHAKPFIVLNSVRLWRLPTGEWYKPNNYGRYTLIAKELHWHLDKAFSKRDARTAYGTPACISSKIVIDFIQEITR